jgi:hypothetical protein
VLCRNLSRKNKNDPERLALHYESAIERVDRNTNANGVYKKTKFETEKCMNKVSHVSDIGVRRNLQRKNDDDADSLAPHSKNTIGDVFGHSDANETYERILLEPKTHK